MSEVRERPILFSGSMVKAILRGEKTQTRRVIAKFAATKPRYQGMGYRKITEFQPSSTSGYDWIFRSARGSWNDFRHDELLSMCPYGIVGDRLWVRETWRSENENHPRVRICYRADMTSWGHAIHMETSEKLLEFPEPVYESRTPWKPSIFMPRWASRLTLEITDVRIERLQDISHDDAKAEGAEPLESGNLTGNDYRGAFRQLWQAISGVKSWDANPFVWAVTFKRLEQK
jgi:hypothetical protein